MCWWENALAALNAEGGKLSFSSVAPATAALFAPDNWAMAYTRPWTASLGYSLAPGTVPSGAATGLVFRLGDGSSLPSLGFHYSGVAIYASEQGTFLGICDTGAMMLTDVEPVAPVPSGGTVVVSYNANSVNNFRITGRGARPIPQEN